MLLLLYFALPFCRLWAVAGDIKASGCNMAHLMSTETEKVEKEQENELSRNKQNRHAF